MAEAGDDPENMAKAQALFNQLQAMKDEAQAIAQKISELDQERHEHSLVAETLEKIDGERKCFRCGCATLRSLRCGRIERPVCVLTISIGGSSAHARSQALASTRAHGATQPGRGHSQRMQYGACIAYTQRTDRDVRAAHVCRFSPVFPVPPHSVAAHLPCAHAE